MCKLDIAATTDFNFLMYMLQVVTHKIECNWLGVRHALRSVLIMYTSKPELLLLLGI